MKRARSLRAVRGTAAVTLIAVLAIALWQVLAKDAKPDALTLGLLVLGTASLTAMLQPAPFAAALARVRSLDLFGVKVELEVERVSNIARRFPEYDDVPDRDDAVKTAARPLGETPAESIDKVATELRRKLRFVRKAVVGDPDSLPEELVIARLEYLQLLKPDEAGLCREVLGGLRDGIGEWEEAERDGFLDGAWTFAVRLASEMFDRHARRRFKEAGWFVADFDQPRGHRADFLAKHEEAWALVAARVAAPHTTLDRTVKRLARDERDIPREHSVVVIPDYVDHQPPDLKDKAVSRDGVILVRLGVLLGRPDWLSAAEPSTAG